MSGKIFLFTGPDKYSLNQELQFWASSFRQKYGEDSVDTYNSENWDSNKVNQSVFGGGLFVVKKMTIIKGLPVSTEKGTGFTADVIGGFTENFMKNYAQIPDDNIIIFVSPNPDKRGKFFKFFQNEFCNIKEYNPISTIQLKSKIKQEFGDIKIAENEINFFIDTVGTDLYQVMSEIDKLKEYCKVHNINEVSHKMIEDIVFGLTDSNVFAFLNLAFVDTLGAIKYLEKIEESGMTWIEFAGAIYSQLKSSIMIYRLYEQGIKDGKEIASQCGLNPAAVFVNLKNIKEISKNGLELENMYKCLVQTDINIKSGINEDTEFRLNTKKMITKFKK